MSVSSNLVTPECDIQNRMIAQTQHHPHVAYGQLHVGTIYMSNNTLSHSFIGYVASADGAALF